MTLIYLILFLGALTFAYTVVTTQRTRAHEIATTKRDKPPAHPVPGTCQCGDAFSFHDPADGQCKVNFCGCRRFVPSDMDADQLTALTSLWLEAQTRRALPGPVLDAAWADDHTNKKNKHRFDSRGWCFNHHGWCK